MQKGGMRERRYSKRMAGGHTSISTECMVEARSLIPIATVIRRRSAA